MSAAYTDQIYLGTVLLEKNRWARERVPSLAISEWLPRIAAAGFDGLELWQNHALLADDEERERLRQSPAPVKIFNSYARCEHESGDERTRSAECARFFGAEGMKFNFGRDLDRHEEYVRSVKAWRAELPARFRFLCECHGGTTVQEPRAAAEALRRSVGEDYEVIVHGFGGADEDLKRAFAIHEGHITHVHANLSPQGPPCEAEVRRRVELLRHDLGFRGSFTLEFTEGVKDPEQTAETWFRHAVRDLELLRAVLGEG